MLPSFLELIPSVSHRHISVLHSGMIISTEKSTTDLDLARDRQRRRKTENILTDGMNRGRTCTAMRHPIALPSQDQVLNH